MINSNYPSESAKKFFSLRFFAPPPCIYLLGAAWERKQRQIIQAGHGEEGAQICAFIGIGNSNQELQQLDFTGKVGTLLKNFFVTFKVEHQSNLSLSSLALLHC